MSQIKDILVKLDKFKELILVPPLSIIIFRIFFSERRASVFDVVALGALLIWRFVVRDRPFRPLPKLLIVTVCLYILSDFAGALLSDDQLWELAELRKYVHVFIGALLFTLPLEGRTRKILIALFFIAASIAGVQGIWSYFTGGIYWKARGSLPHSILYAETLALAGGSAFLMLFTLKQVTRKTLMEFLFLSIVSLVTLAGILFSQSRGVWVALIVASTATQLLYDLRKTVIFISCFIAVLAIPFYYGSSLSERAKSIVTSVYAENETGSTGIRLELWKGALLIFKEHPLLGAGSGNFESNIKKLVQEKKLKATPIIVHAHNIYLQALATRGIVGFTILAASLTALITWGFKEMKSHGGIGGYVIIFCTILTMAGGLTENNLGTTKYLAAYCFTMGLLGPLTGSIKENPASKLYF